ncbi:MAG: hypothetical protein AB7O26_11590 [Planctomycetaceae bacterium]
MTGTWSHWFWRQPDDNGGSRRDRYARRTRSQAERTSAQLAERVAALEEANRKLESINRIQQVEIDELTAVVARNLERVKAETRLLANPTSDRHGMPHILSTEQEFASHD